MKALTRKIIITLVLPMSLVNASLTSVGQDKKANVDTQASQNEQDDQNKLMEERFETRVEIGGGAVTINYGRPSSEAWPEYKLGTTEAGDYWKLGGGRATRLDTEIDLKFGNTVVTKGRYLLRARKITEDQWALTVNRVKLKEIIWLAEVPLLVKRSNNTVKNLVIKLERHGSDVARLTIEWGTIIAAAELRKA
jgi:Protein of unknown function (DUF2911)